MEKNPKYMYLESIKKRVSLHAKKGYCSWRIGDETFRITAGIERMLVYALYVGKEGYNFYELARLNLPDYVSLNANPEFIRSSFEKAHPLEDIEDYDYSMIPEYADPVHGMWLDGDGETWSFWITLEDEKAIMAVLNDHTPWQNGLFRLRSIARRYSMNIREDLIEQSLKGFLIQHGIEPGTIRKKERAYFKEQEAERRALAEAVPVGDDANGSRRRNNKSEENSTVVASIVLGIVMSIAIVVTWVSMSMGVKVPIAGQPFHTLLMMLAMDLFFTKSKGSVGFGIYCVAFLVASAITSLVGMLMDWELGMGGNAISSAINFFTPAIYGMLRGGQGFGR